MPYHRLRPFLRMMPRLLAEESFRAAQAVAVGSGTLSQRQSRAIQRDWTRAADATPAKQGTPDPSQLAAIGIGVVTRDG